MVTSRAILKTPRELTQMRQAGSVVAIVLDEIRQRISPGWSTAEIDAYADRRVRQLGCTPSFKGYRGFPASTCVSVNHEVVHGIPSPRKILLPGDLVKVDLGAMFCGWHGDACITIGLDPLTDAARDLLIAAERALHVGLSRVKSDVYLQEVSGAIQDAIEGCGYSTVRQYVGHGVGRNLHEAPHVPNFRTSQLPNPKLEVGMTLAIEPIVNAGGAETRVLDDRWTVVTADGELSAQFEHTVAVTKTGYEILTERWSN